MKNFFLIAIALASLVSCRGNSEYKAESTGTPYEVVVITDTATWNSAACDTLKRILSEPVPMLNQEEPMFRVLQVTPDKQSGILRRHRNIIMVRIDKSFERTAVGASYDVEAAPQMILYMDSPNTDSLASYLHKNAHNIVFLMDNAEQQNFVSRAKKLNEPAIADSIKNVFGIDINIPRGYKIRNIMRPDFMWISYETPQASQGFFIYSYPIDSIKSLTQDELISMRNVFASNIPGPSEHSYMTTSMAYPPESHTEQINDRTWIVTRGFWDVENDFMGGPFVSFSTMDRPNNRIITIDQYVYSPKTSKGRRNYIKQLESIIRTVKIDK